MVSQSKSKRKIQPNSNWEKYIIENEETTRTSTRKAQEWWWRWWRSSSSGIKMTQENPWFINRMNESTEWNGFNWNTHIFCVYHNQFGNVIVTVMIVLIMENISNQIKFKLKSNWKPRKRERKKIISNQFSLLFCFTLFCCAVMLCYAMLCYIMLYCVLSCFIILFPIQFYYF